MRVAIVGTGYVGLVSGACLADLGHQVTCVDTDENKITKLKSGVMPIFEQGLEELVKRNVQSGHLSFTSDFTTAIPGAEVISIAVGTPSAEDGSVDMQFIDSAAGMISRYLSSYAVIATKSTVPVGTCERLTRLLAQGTTQICDVVSNPEFLREGRAVYDFLHPSRIVIGAASPRAADIMLKLYTHLDCPKLVMDQKSAELCKYASNTFLATKISFVNEIAHLCEEVGADIEPVARAMGLDPRIGKDFLHAGLGWGGSCFPKDVRALHKLGQSLERPLPVVTASIQTNQLTRQRAVERLERALLTLHGKKLCMLGVSFKANTDDTRESPAMDLIRHFVERGAKVVAYDPVARPDFGSLGLSVNQVDSPYIAAQGADATVIATEWEEFRNLDLKRLKEAMAGDVLFDARNLIDPDLALRERFRYFRVGRVF
jgi:UDPglucose 6-dehydrogenase